jgi:glycosyltransferase involved in cell wall biosynthesis
MQPIRVIHLLYSGMGGTGTYFMEFVRSDRHKAFENIAVFFGIEAPSDDYASFCDQHGIDHVTVPKRQGLDLRSYAKIYDILARYRPDAVFIHSATACPPVFLYAANRRCRTIFIEHSASAVKSRADWLASRLAQRFASNVIVFYEQQVRELVAKFGNAVQRHKITIIPKTVDVQLFTPRSTPNGETIAIGMQSRLQPAKDHATLLRAFASLLTHTYGNRLHLRIAGDGVTRPALEALARDLGISERITFTGTLNTSSLCRFLQELDVYVHASTGETVCYAIMEAQAAGLPIVAADVEGINNVIHNGVNGFLYKPGDDRALGKVIHMLIEDHSLRERYGRLSRALMEDLSSRSNMADAYYKILSNKSARNV